MRRVKDWHAKDLQVGLLVLLLLFLVTIQFIGGSESQNSRSSTFEIVESDAKTPLEGARVLVSANNKALYQTLSDSNGRVALPSLDSESLTIEISAQGYISERLTGQQASSLPGTIRLFKEGILKGKVISRENRKGISGARLNLWGPRGQLQTSSDHQGDFYLGQLPGGKYTLALTIEGFAPLESEQIEIHGGRTIEREFTLQVGGLFTGKILDAETQKPLRNIYVSLYGSHYYSDTTDRNGFFSFANISAGRYQISIYHEGFKQLRQSTIEISEGQSLLNQVYSLEPLEPQFQIYSNQPVFLPGEKIEIRLRSYRIPRLECKLYRISPEELRADKGDWVRRPNTLLKNRMPFSKWTKDINIQEITRWQTRTITFPLSKKGFYVLELSYRDSRKYWPFFHTDLGLIAKSAPASILVWSHRLSNSQPVSNASIELESNSNRADGKWISTPKGRTAQNGLLQFSVESNSSYNVWVFSENDASYVEVYNNSFQSRNMKSYIYTDRPVYRPGHTVYYKGIVRREKGDVYEVVSNATFPLLIRDAGGTILQQSQVTTSRHGSFSGEFKLADEPALGTYGIELSDGGSSRGEFRVLEYRKPEFEIKVIPDQTRYHNGGTIRAKILATYYFGSPVSNRPVDYSVLDARYYSWNNWNDDSDEETEYDDYYGYGKVITSGTVQLDAHGEGLITIPVNNDSFDRYYNIEAKIIDESRREVTGRARVLVTRGEYKIGIFTESYVFQVGEKVPFRVKTADYDENLVSVVVQVQANYSYWSPKNHRYEYSKVWIQKLHTGPDGLATFSFTPTRGGYLSLEAFVKDPLGNKINATRFVWVAGTDDSFTDWYNQRTLDLIPDKRKKEPGEQARILINSSKANVYALLTLEGSALHKAQVIRLQGHTRLVTVPTLAQYAPSLYVSVSFTWQKQFYNRAIALEINPSQNFLNIQIAPDKKQYKPQETAVYQIKITDKTGKPVETEFSFGLVDESVYAISPELVQDITKFFYGAKPNRVITYYSFPPRYLGGADKDGNKQIRKDFPDTAFWNATARTDANGTATLPVKLPDSLTTWRATVRAASDQTRVGSATNKVITAKTLIARLETPRFFTVGDKLIITAVLHNLSGKTLDVNAEVTADDKLQFQERKAKRLRLNAQDIRRVDWNIQAARSGRTRIVLKADASIDFDGMQLDVPVLPFGIERFGSFSGQTNLSITKSFTVPDIDLQTAHLKLYFTPSIAGMAFDSLEYLTGYPYGCVEQTMSKFLPDVVVSKALKQLHIPNEKLSNELPKQINAGLQRLYHFQHEDGGWGWWENDETHPYMTAYVIYGLSLSKDAGFAVDESRFANGLAALKRLYDTKETDDTRAYILFALSHTGREKDFVLAKIVELEKRFDQMNPYSLATLTIASEKVGNRSLALKLLNLLSAKAAVSESYAFWVTNEFAHGWCDNQVETAAYPLQAFLRIQPDNPIIPKIVRWLVDQRQGNRWYSTKDTAATIIALMEYLQTSNELAGNYSAKFSLNDTPVGELQVTPQNVWNVRKELDLYSPTLRSGENRLRIDITGNGRLYFAGQVRYFENGKTATAENKGIQVRREYFRYKRTLNPYNYAESASEILKGNVKVGEEVLVKLSIQADHDYEYTILEDPLPSGFEVVTDPRDHYEWTYWYCRREVRDEKTAFFSTWLWKGKREIYYIIRAEVPGSLQVSPAQSWAMYLPEIRGNSTGNFLTVID